MQDTTWDLSYDMTVTYIIETRMHDIHAGHKGSLAHSLSPKS